MISKEKVNEHLDHLRATAMGSSGRKVDAVKKYIQALQEENKRLAEMILDKAWQEDMDTEKDRQYCIWCENGSELGHATNCPTRQIGANGENR